MNEIEQNHVFQYYSNSRQLEKNENCVHQEEFKSIVQFNYTSIKNFNKNIRQSSIHCQCKVSIAVKIVFFIYLYFKLLRIHFTLDITDGSS